MKLVRLPLLAALTCLAFVGTTGVASAASSRGPNLTALYNAARSNGETSVSIYNPFPPAWAELVAAFERRYPGIRVTQTATSGLPMRAKVKAERSAGRVTTDLLNCPIQDCLALSKSRVFTPFTPVANLPSRYVGRDRQWAVYGQGAGLSGYNRNAVSGSEIPRTYDDLVNPRFRGRIGIGDMNAGTSAITSYTAFLYYKKIIGKRFIQRLAQSNAVVFPSPGAQVNALATGQIVINPLIGATTLATPINRGAPVGVVPIRQPIATTPAAIAVLAGAPHPNAAKLWAAFMQTAEAQRLITRVPQMATRRGIQQNAIFRGLRFTSLTMSEWAYKIPRATAQIQKIFRDAS